MRHIVLIVVCSLGCASSTSEPRAATSSELPTGCLVHAQPLACNPLTNAGCAAGEACGDDDRGGFKCYAPPNEVDIDGDCNVVEGPSCKPSLACVGTTDADPNGSCAKLCCSSAECGGKSCTPFDPKAGTLGTCT